MPGYDWEPQKVVRITPDDTGGALLDQSAQIVEELSNMPVLDEVFGFAIDTDGSVTLPDGRRMPKEYVAIAMVQSMLANVYFAGRADQISDMFSNNVQRTVKARDLRSMLHTANFHRGHDEQLGVTEELMVFDSLRGALGRATVKFASSSEEALDKLYALLDEIDIQILTPYELRQETLAIVAEARDEEEGGFAGDSADDEMGEPADYLEEALLGFKPGMATAEGVVDAAYILAGALLSDAAAGALIRVAQDMIDHDPRPAEEGRADD